MNEFMMNLDFKMHGNERLRKVSPHPVSIEFSWKYFKFPKFPVSKCRSMTGINHSL